MQWKAAALPTAGLYRDYAPGMADKHFCCPESFLSSVKNTEWAIALHFLLELQPAHWALQGTYHIPRPPSKHHHKSAHIKDRMPPTRQGCSGIWNDATRLVWRSDMISILLYTTARCPGHQRAGSARRGSASREPPAGETPPPPPPTRQSLLSGCAVGSNVLPPLFILFWSPILETAIMGFRFGGITV